MAIKETRQNYFEPQVKQISDKIVKATDKAVLIKGQGSVLCAS
jgi:hypothetical protein